MATLKLTLDKRRPKKDKTYPLIFRISVHGKSRDIPLGYSILLEHWSSRNSTLKTTAPAYEILAKRIQELKIKYLSKIVEYEVLNQGGANIKDIKKYILCVPQQNEVVTVECFWKQEIEYLHRANRSGGARSYIESFSALNKIQKLNIPFTDIDYKFLKKTEEELISRGLKLNSIGVYFRTLRAIYNKAIYAKIVSFEHYPFRNFKIKKEPTRPRVLSKNELHLFFNLNLPTSSYLYESWLIGKLMFMLIGINFKDLGLMTEKQIQHGRLIYTRAKTKRQYSIKLLPEAIEILNYFKGRCEHTVLGKIKPLQLQDKIHLPLDIKQANKVFNNHLHKIGKQIGCNEKLTGYCFRYSTANIAKQLGYSKDIISEALGHSMGLRVTGLYLENFDLDLVDRMNEHVCYTVMK